MDMLQYCWIVSITILLISLVCMVTNNLLFAEIKYTIHQMTNVFKPGLILFHKPNEARFITTDELPLLQTWYIESINYGVINILGVVTSIALLISIAVFHQLTYIIALGSAMFLGSNLLFFPRACTRRYRLVRMLLNYHALLKMLDTVEQAKDTTPENTNDDRTKDSP